MNKTYHYFTLILTMLGSIVFSACSEDDDSSQGDNFEDVPEAYILTPQTNPSKKLPQRNDGLNSYLIRNASDFRLFIDLANSGHDFGDYATIELNHDLTISEEFEWTPIGYSQYPLDVNIDGKGHTIKGVLNARYSADGFTEKVDGANYRSSLYGLFGYACGEIRDLNLELDLLFQDAIISHLGTYPVIGILGGVLTSNVTGVHIDGDIIFASKIISFSGNSIIIGGLAGIMNYGALTDCSTKGRIDISAIPVGPNNYSMKMDYAYIGGMTGLHRQGTSEKCTSQMDINIEHGAIKGVLAVGGYMGRTADSNVPAIKGFTNHGDITLSDIHKIKGTGEQMIAAGGVFGYNGGTTLAPVNVVNTGDISVGETSHTAYVGGFEGFVLGNDLSVGTNEGNISNSAKRGFTGGCFGLVIGASNSAGSTLENKGNISSDIFVDDRGEENGGLSLHTKGISGYTGGIAGATIAGTKIKNASNYGNISTPAPFKEYGEDISLAGAIVGYGECEFGTCLNYGEVNGRKLAEATDPHIFVGYLWLPWERMEAGAIDESHPYWHVWHDMLSSYQYW